MAALLSASPALAAGTSLAGAWHAHIGDLDRAPDQEPTWPLMPVPSNWYRQGLDHAGVVWFARTVELPAPARWAITFEGVDYAADVYWDGRHVGAHRGYFAPFTVELGAAVGPHLLAVRVDSPNESDAAFSLHKTLIKGVLSHHDTRPGGAWSPRGQDANTGGIWGTVELHRRRAGRIERPRVTTRSASAAAARLEIAAHALAFDTGHAGAATATATAAAELRYRLLDPDGRTVAHGRLGPVDTHLRELRRTVRLPRPRRWWPAELGEPALYTLELYLRGPGGTDLVRLPFGIRTVREQDGRFLVNDTPLFLRGTNYIGSLYFADFHPADIERDLRLMLDAHVNAVRVHAHLAPGRFYDLADRLGLVVWQDFPLQWGYDDSPAFSDEAVRQVGEMLATLGHHPSIGHWTAHNEAPWSSDWMAWKYRDYDPDQNRALDHRLAAALARDPSRPHRANAHPTEHAWMGWYSGTLHDFQRPISQPFLTEYGAQAVPALETLRTFLMPAQLWPLDAQNLPAWEYHNFQLHELRDNAKVPLGASVEELIANTQRYQARLLQTAAESLRLQKWQPVGGVFQFMFVEHWPSMNWGVVDYLRRPKQGYQALARAYQPLLPVAVRKPQRDRLTLYIVNDTKTDRDLWLRVGDDDAAPLTPVHVAADAVTPLLLELPLPRQDPLHLSLLDREHRLVADNLYPTEYFDR
ncbi:MAG TPA: glycoside hydrolase family 2 TIM barrel-domain containing protein [Polyangia bacterium]|nr:glycoside hydrolase family 2 TIM barrel-domain containing protein [Polyangia bacterium]